MWGRNRTARAVAEAEYIAALNSGGASNPTNLGNWLTMWTRTTSGGGNPATQTAPSSTCIAAGCLKTSLTGLYLVQGSVIFDSQSSPDVIALKLSALQSAGPGTLAATGFAPYGFASATAVHHVSGTLGADGAGGPGIELDGAAFTTGPILMTNGSGQEQQSTTANVQYEWSFSGIFGDATKDVKTPFIVGDFAAFGILVSATGSVDINQVALTITEWPFG